MAGHVISMAVEGIVDQAIASKILRTLDLPPGPPYVANGKGQLDLDIPRYNAAARHGFWFVLRDLDNDADCAAALNKDLLPKRAKNLCLRIPVRAVESWLLGDADSLASFLSVSPKHIPGKPDEVFDPKIAMINLARKSRKRQMRVEMVPAQGTSAKVGPGYTSNLIEFASQKWNPINAAARSPSLNRCLFALSEWREVLDSSSK